MNPKTELELLKRIAAHAPRPRRGLAVGIGDDCAVFRPPGSKEDLLISTDLTIEGVHFLPEMHPALVVGWRSLARGLSDIAAMGGEPLFCLVSLALAAWADEHWLDGFYHGLLRLARRTGTSLAGGDLARAECVTCDIVVCGSVPRGKALRRSGARPGDCVYVSGRLGAAALGLQTRHGAAWQHHAFPEPRLAEGRALLGRATACMDLSDGLSLDLHRLCLASHVAAELENVPLFRGASREQALDGGEDYELLYTGPAGLPGIAIGQIVRGEPGLVKLNGELLPPHGFDHFAKG